MTDNQGPDPSEEPTAPVTPEPPPAAESAPGAPPPPPGFEPPGEQTGEQTAPVFPAGPLGGPAAEDEPVAGKSRKKLWWTVGVAAVLLAALVGGAAWAVVSFLLPKGEPVTAALPASTVAFASIDLDPSATQKLAALSFMRKFPGITDNLTFDPQTTDDLRRWLTDAIGKDPTCPNFDFDTQIGPWLGQRAAVAGAPNADGKLTPFVVVQVTDLQKAKDAIANNFGCNPDPSGTPTAVASVGQYLVVAEKQADADYFAQEAQKSPLTDDADYQSMMAKVGTSGIASAYVAPSATNTVLDELGKQPGMSGGELDLLRSQYANFAGMAAVVRFDGGSLEVEAAGSMGQDSPLPGGVAPVGDLPASTFFAFGGGYAQGDAETQIKKSWDQLMSNDPTYQQDVSAVEQETGLTLPDDLITLVGGGYAFAVDSSLDPNIFTAPNPPSGTQLPIGFRFVGDPQAISAVLQKLNALIAPSGFPLAIEQGDGVVGVSLSSEYAKQLAAPGDLGTSASYLAAVSQQSTPSNVMYLDLGTVRSWIETLDPNDPSMSSVLDNMAPLGAVGISSYVEGDTGHFLMRLTTN